MRHVESDQLTASESTTKQHGQHGAVTQATAGLLIRGCQKPLALLGTQPVADSGSESFGAGDPGDTGYSFGTEQAQFTAFRCQGPNSG